MHLYSCHAPGEPMGSTRWSNVLVGMAGANAVDDADAFKTWDEGECGAGRVCTGDRHRVGGVEGADQHAHHHFPGAEVPGFRDITDHNSVDRAGCFSNSSKHAFSLVQSRSMEIIQLLEKCISTPQDYGSR